VSTNDNYNLFINFFGDYKRGFGIYLTVLSIYFITKISNQPKIDATKVIRYLLLSAISIIIYQLFQIIDLDFIKISNAQTYSSLIGNINMAGSLVAAFSLSLLSANQIFKKNSLFITSLLIPLILYSIIKFDSQQAYLVLLVGLSTYAYFVIMKKMQIPNLVASIIYAGIWILGIFVLLRIIKINWLFELLNKDGNYARRIDYWNQGIKIFLENPLLGVGLNGFLDKYNQIRSVESIKRDGADAWIDSPHSVPIQMLSTGGLILFLSWILFILIISYYAIRNLQDSASAKFGGKLQLTIACMWFGFCAQFLVSIWETSMIISASVLSALVLNQRFIPPDLNSRDIMKTKKVYDLQKYKSISQIMLSIVAIFLFATQILFANYVNKENSSNKVIVNLTRFFPNYFLLDYLAYSDLSKARVTQAVNLEKISITLNPQNSKAYYQLGISYRYLGELIEAEEMLSFALRLDPLNLYVLEQLVKINVDLGNKSNAENYYLKIIAIDPNFRNIDNLTNLIEK